MFNLFRPKVSSKQIIAANRINNIQIEACWFLKELSTFNPSLASEESIGDWVTDYNSVLTFINKVGMCAIASQDTIEDCNKFIKNYRRLYTKCQQIRSQILLRRY